MLWSEVMYAIVETGGKQYRVQPGDVISVELLDVVPGQDVELSRVLFISHDNGSRVGTPVIEGCSVKATCVDEVKGPKVVSVKYKQRKNIRRKFGHRQRYSQLRIVDIIGV